MPLPHSALEQPITHANPLRGRILLAGRYATMASAITILVSIPVSQILLGVAIVCLLLARVRFRWPFIFWPLGCFLGWLLLSLLMSPEPWAGMAQLKKIYVFTMLPVALAALPAHRDYFAVFAGWVAVAAASVCLALGQFVWKLLETQQQGVGFYQAYVADRITGFMSHWMTFSGQAMLVLLLLLSYLLFGPKPSVRWRAGLWMLAALLLAGIVLGYTRGVWIATAIAVLPLLWNYRRWLAIAAPAGFVVLLAFGPSAVQDRFVSIFKPHGEMDSNQHRVVTFATGLAMIREHPWFGIGPERVGPHVEQYAPAWIKRPLPEGYYGHLHSIYMHYPAERGVPALLFLLLFFAVLLQRQWHALRSIARSRSLAHALHLGVIAVVAGILVGGLFEYNLGDSEILTMFLVVVAAGYSSGPSPGRNRPASFPAVTSSTAVTS